MYRKSVLTIFFWGVLIILSAGSATASDDTGVQLSPQWLQLADSLGKAADYDSALVILNRIRGSFDEIDTSTDTSAAGLFLIFGSCYFDLGKYNRAEGYLDTALTIREAVFGCSAGETAEIMVKLGDIYLAQGRYDRSEEILVEARYILEDDSSERLILAECYRVSVPLYTFKNDYIKADSLADSALTISRRESEPDLDMIAKSLNVKGNVSYYTGNYDEAKAAYLDALETYQELYGEKHPSIASSISNLANLHRIKGEYAIAESLLVAAINMDREFFGDGHSILSARLNNLSSLYWRLGRFGEMEPILEEAVKILRNTVGDDHPEMAASLNCMAALNLALGKYSPADTLFRKALEILKKSYGPNHTTVATLLNNLGNINSVLGNYDIAKGYMLESMEIRKKLLGEKHPDVATSLGAIARLMIQRLGEYDEAEVYLNEALSIKKDLLGSNHPDVARIYKDMGDIRYQQGRLDEAIAEYKKSLGIMEMTHGYLHPNVYQNLKCLGRAYAAMDSADSSLVYLERFMDLALKLTDYAFSYSSETQKLRWINKYPVVDNSIFTLAVQSHDERATALAGETLLKGKASVIDAIMIERETAFCSEDRRARELLDSRNEICTMISNMVLSSVRKAPQENFLDSVQMLYKINDSLEEELSRICSTFKNELFSRRFELDDIYRAIPEGAVLLEYMKYTPSDFNKVFDEEDDEKNARYLAFLFKPSGELLFRNLGAAAEIDSLVDLTREKIYQFDANIFTPLGAAIENDLSRVTSVLYDRLIGPVEAELEEAEFLYISPDSKLNLLSFEILVRPDTSYLVEAKKICYLSTGRELLELSDVPGVPIDAMILADPDFDKTEGMTADGGVGPDMGADFTSNDHQARGTASECLDTAFPPLRYGHTEMTSLIDIFVEQGGLNIRDYYGAGAGEEVLKSIIMPPGILHLVTHGFFCELSDENSRNPANPLLNSGLALAGVNRMFNDSNEISEEEDGILTAYEVSGLNLVGTELAALSACETGVGHAVRGEGIFGLQRAFRHAGARSVLMSLWKIMDKETSLLMESFYRRWLDGNSKIDALRDSQLEQLNHARQTLGHGHPLLWAGFILIGDPR